MKNSKNNSRKQVLIEALEGRTLMAATPLAIAEVAVTGGTQLQITGTVKNDRIEIKQTETGLQVTATGFSQTFASTYASIRVNGSKGNDVVTVDASVTTNAYLFGGAGNDTITGGAGDDVIVTIGGGKDVVAGGAGSDSFWTDKAEKINDASADENANSVHRVSSFGTLATKVGKKIKTTKISMELDGQNLVDPTLSTGTTGYKNFSSNPLFSANGPTADDVAQGYLGDCYYLSTLSSIASINPNKIRESIVDLGDGTYAVEFNKNGTEVYVRVDADLPVNGNSLAYADLGKQNSTWVALMEKAFAYFRTGTMTYASIEAGWMGEACSALGVSSSSIYAASSASNLMSQISAQLEAGKAVTYATTSLSDQSLLVGGHAYQVVSATATSLTLRNPWAIDGYSCKDGSNDGYVTITAAQAFKAFSGATFAQAA